MKISDVLDEEARLAALALSAPKGPPLCGCCGGAVKIRWPKGGPVFPCGCLHSEGSTCFSCCRGACCCRCKGGFNALG